MTSSVRRAAIVAAVIVLSVALGAAPAGAELYDTPHGYYPSDSDICALCHRAHIGTAVSIGRREEVPLCYSCHGADGQGSNLNVQTAFQKASRHLIEPETSTFGPSPKTCSDCHNVHGDIDPEGTLIWQRGVRVSYFPKLIRSRTNTIPPYWTGNEFHAREEYCGACHATAPEPLSIDTTLYRQTAHWTTGTGISDPPSGTRIRCMRCHVPHGSQVAPLLRPVTNGATVTANDRSQCYACHSALRALESTTAYAGSSHGEATGTSAGRDLSACQQCHDPHGAKDLDGYLPRFTRRLEERLCYGCHGPDGPAAADLETPVPASSASPRYEVLAAVTPEPPGAEDVRVAVLSQETSGSAPRALRGPWEHPLATGARSLGIGDFDGDGAAEVVAGKRSTTALSVLRQSAVSGLVPGPSVDTTSFADDLAVADVTGDSTSDVVFVSRADAVLSVYTWQGGVLDIQRSYPSGGVAPSGLAIGDINGDGARDVAVVNAGSDNLAVFYQGPGGTLISPPDTFAAESSPTGAAIGDIDDDGDAEVVVANGEADSVKVWTWTGATLSSVATYAVQSVSGARPRDVAIGPLLAGYPGREVAVSLWHETSQSGVNVFRSAGGGALSFVEEATTGVGARSWDIGVADIDGDGGAELAVADAGTRTAAPPSVSVFPGGAITLGARRGYALGGTQDGGTRMRLAVGDVGSLYPYRHAAEAVGRSHESTEVTVAVAARHAECVDCHNTHVADTSTASAPDTPGPLKGAWGIAVANGGAGGEPGYSTARPVQREYEVCFKCHSGLAGQTGARDLALLLNPANASYHPVEASGANATIAAAAWTGSWSAASRTYCSDCHGAYGVYPAAGPHFSTAPSILRGPYIGAADRVAGACYQCHNPDVYYLGVESIAVPASRFFDTGYPTPQLHSLHLKDRGMDCRACHVPHGSPFVEHLLRDDLSFAHDATGGANGGGSCGPVGCHDTATKGYRAAYP